MGKRMNPGPTQYIPAMPRSSKQILRHRRSLKTPQPITPLGWAFLTVVAAGVGWWLVSTPSHFFTTLVVLAGLWLWSRIADTRQSRKFDRMAKARSGESICQFARHFRGAGFDPVLVRAVYELIQELYGRTDIPIRPTDRFSEEYGLLADDLDDLGADVASLAHRSLASTQQNPLYSKVQTVEDLVHFLQFQPQLAP
jgi:hypothetical protein